MMNSVNIMGRLTADPDLRETQAGLSVLNFTIACTQRSGEKGTDFIDCTAWRQTAEIIARYKHKGDMLAVSGRLETHTYQDQSGAKRKAVTVVVQDVTFVGGRAEAKPEEAQTVQDEGFVEIEDGELPF